MTVDPRYHDRFGDYDPDVDSFASYNWKSKAAKDQWNDLVDRMMNVSAAAEWQAVLDDEAPRKLALVNVSHGNMESWLTRAGKHGLVTRTLQYVEPYSGFAHGHTHTGRDNPERLCFTAVAETEDVLDAAEEAYESEDSATKHSRLGELLGFPACCRDHFLENWLGEPSHDPMYEAACNTPSAERVEATDEYDHVRVTDPSPWVNPMWRYFGLRFITHLPCSFECEASERIAYHRGRLIEAQDEEAAHALKSWLDAPFTWSGHNAIAHIRNEAVAAQVNSSPYLQEKRITWKGEHAPGGKVPGTSDGVDGTTVTP